MYTDWELSRMVMAIMFEVSLIPLDAKRNASSTSRISCAIFVTQAHDGQFSFCEADDQFAPLPFFPIAVASSWSFFLAPLKTERRSLFLR